MQVGTKHICNEPDHISQFDFLLEVFTGVVKDFIVWANRSGSKSFFAGLISWAESCFYKDLETCILGGSKEQADKSYKAMNDFWKVAGLIDEMLAKEPMLSETIWKDGSSVSILTASQHSVRGPHPQRLNLDEVDEMDFDIFEASMSMPQSKHGVGSATRIYSTNHNVEGTMDRVLKTAREKGGYKIFKWCIWECLESCKDYTCSTCQLNFICPGKQMKEADGYYKIEDFIKKLNNTSWDTIQREWLCKKIGRGDLVYQNEFDEDKHFIDVAIRMDLYVILSIDWGGTHPFSVGAWQYFPEDELGWVRVDEVYMGNTDNPHLIAECSSKPWWRLVSEFIPDPSRPDLIKEWQVALPKANLIQANNDRDSGIEAVKNALRPVLGKPKIHFNKNTCKNLLREFYSYCVKKGNIVKENDHALDEVRYFVKCKIADDNEMFALTTDYDVIQSH